MRKSLMSLRLALGLALLASAQPVVAQGTPDFRYVLTPDSPALSQPQGIAVGSTSRRTFVADTGRHVIRDVIPTRAAAILAGALDQPGTADGPVTEARFNSPTGLAFLEVTDTLYIADTGNHTIRKIQNGVVTTIAGLAGVAGTADGTGSAARFNQPHGVAVRYNPNTQATTLLVADTGNHTIRQISSDGVVTTIAGLAGVPGAADGISIAARFNRPWGIAADSFGFAVTDSANHTIRYVRPDDVDGIFRVTTLLGLAGVPGSADGSGTTARFNTPTGIACCAENTYYLTDTGNHTIRLFTGTVSTMSGSPGVAGSAEGGPATARFRGPTAVAVDGSWDFHVADTGNDAITVGVLTPRSAPTIQTAPLDKRVALGIWADFFCSSSGSPIGTHEWEQTSDGVVWERISDGGSYRGSRTTRLQVHASYALDNRRFRCVVVNELGSAVSPAATLTVTGSVAPTSLRFAATQAPSGGPLVSVTPPQVVTLRWGPGASPSWSASSNGMSWLRITNESGVGDGSFTVAFDPVYPPLTPGEFAAVVIVSSRDDSRSFTLPVHLTVLTTTASRPAFGAIDTPLDNAAGLDGAIPITGWALDDVAVSRVEIWRDRVAGETTPVTVGGPGNGKIFIANATFVPGARPDVEAIFSGVPLAPNGGWGYMLLTHGLYNQGNGTYRLHAFAYDVDGHVTTLGVRTITVDNAHATRPFGTIDIPSYGGTVSGVVQGFGWALTPGFCTIQNPDVQMSVDSGPLTPVSYGDPRPDVAGLFSGYSNASAAGAHFLLDTTQLSNGLHTISFLVTDTCGRSAGLGSRFFTVENK